MKKYLEYAGIVILAVVLAVYIFDRPGKFGASTGLSSLLLSPSASLGDTYGIRIGATTTEDMNGNLVAPILQTNPAALNIMLGANLFGDVVQGANGFSLSMSTSTTITPTQFCSFTSQIASNTVANVSTTLPAATTTYLACGSPAFGAWSQQIIANESTNTLSLVAGSGTTIRYTNGASTTLAASSTWFATGFWEASGTLIINISPTMH